MPSLHDSAMILPSFIICIKIIKKLKFYKFKFEAKENQSSKFNSPIAFAGIDRRDRAVEMFRSLLVLLACASASAFVAPGVQANVQMRGSPVMMAKVRS